MAKDRYGVRTGSVKGSANLR